MMKSMFTTTNININVRANRIHRAAHVVVSKNFITNNRQLDTLPITNSSYS